MPLLRTLKMNYYIETGIEWKQIRFFTFTLKPKGIADVIFLKGLDKERKDPYEELGFKFKFHPLQFQGQIM